MQRDPRRLTTRSGGNAVSADVPDVLGGLIREYELAP
jgi:hypothetical protein